MTISSLNINFIDIKAKTGSKFNEHQVKAIGKIQEKYKEIKEIKKKIENKTKKFDVEGLKNMLINNIESLIVKADISEDEINVAYKENISKELSNIEKKVNNLVKEVVVKQDLEEYYPNQIKELYDEIKDLKKEFEIDECSSCNRWFNTENGVNGNKIEEKKYYCGDNCKNTDEDMTKSLF